MTVSYQYDVASSSTGGFFRLLWRWRGSIWKLLYRELLLFVFIYFALAVIYDFLLNDYYKGYYERLVIFCSNFVELIPLSFILGFYVSFTATRWWNQYTAIPWPDKLMNIIAMYVPGNDETSRILRRTLMRYLNLTLVLVLRSISIPVKRRFPTREHLVEAGFMTKPELDMYVAVPSHEFNTFWIPCTWFVNLLRVMRQECRVTDSSGVKLIMEELNEFRTKCGLLWSYDWVSIPLVYTQVVTLATHAFFVASLIGRQHINQTKEKLLENHQYAEYYIPVFTLLQFILYMGLLKLGEQLINPFGDDDEDFELNWIIDRHLKVSFLGVDILNTDPPPILKDNYFDEMDLKLPYTQAALNYKIRTYRGSVAAFHVPTEDHKLVVPEIEDDEDANEDDNLTLLSGQMSSSTKRDSLWSIFGGSKVASNKSQSISSIDSELMVENSGIEPLFGSTNWSYQRSNGLEDEAKDASERTSQGIRGDKEFVIEVPSMVDKSKQQEQQDKPEEIKKLEIPLFSQELGSYLEKSSRKSSGSRTSSASSVSKSAAQQKLSTSFQMLECKSLNSNVKRSHSAINSKKFRMPKTSLFKGSRSPDVHLKIRPFKSKVTFSDDTKCGDGRELKIPTFFVPKAQEEDSNILDSDNSQLDNSSVKSSPVFQLKIDIPELSFNKNDLLLRRQSACPTKNLHPEAGVSAEIEAWLHHQSLPNIQEGQEDEPDLSSPTASNVIKPISVKRHTSDATSDRFHQQSKPLTEELSKPTDETNEQQKSIDNQNSEKCQNKLDKIQQSSTESDTGSYHTARSVLLQISEDSGNLPTSQNISSTSLDSYSSAAGETQISSSKSKLSVIDSDVPEEMKIVPTITVTQSTPSVLSLDEAEKHSVNSSESDNKEVIKQSKITDPVKTGKIIVKQTAISDQTDDIT